MMQKMKMVKEFREFAQSMNGKDPQQAVMKLLTSGQMTNTQFQELQQQATEFQQLLNMFK